ncbi:MAG: glycosyltransferase family 2 protein, partial [Myxococcota bacterium]
LLALFFIDSALAWNLFRSFWVLAGLVYLVVTLISFVVDPESAKKTWWEGIVFPGYYSLGLIVYSLVPELFFPVVGLLSEVPGLTVCATLFSYAWQSLSMLVAYGAKVAEDRGFPRLASVLLNLAGYGPLLCAVTFGAYVKEWQGAAMTWDKTVKTGKVA